MKHRLFHWFTASWHEFDLWVPLTDHLNWSSHTRYKVRECRKCNSLQRWSGYFNEWEEAGPWLQMIRVGQKRQTEGKITEATE